MTDRPTTAKAFVAANVSRALTAHFVKTGERQGAFGERAGVAQSSVSKYASGTNTPNTEQLVAIAEALDVSLDLLVLGKERKPREVDPVRRREVIGEFAGMDIVADPEVEPGTIEIRPDDPTAPRKVKL